MTVRDALMLSNAAFLLFGALTIIAGVFLLFLNRAVERTKDRELAAYQTAAEVRIHSARADAAEALERAVARETENLKTRALTALLVRDAVALHAQTLAARSQGPQAVGASPAPTLHAGAPGGDGLADGTLSGDQRGKMISILIRRPGDVTVMNGAGSDAERRAAELRAVFRASGWQVESGVAIDPKVPLAPLSLVLGTSEQDKAVRRAFAAAGVGVTERPRSPIDRPTTIYVGAE
jgi:hypothetical protein